jgi:hypothetical protein
MAYRFIERTERTGFIADGAKASGEAATLPEVPPGSIVTDDDSYFDMRTQRGDGDLWDQNFFDLKDAGVVIHLY